MMASDSSRTSAVELARASAVIAHHSKSFALASKLLPPEVRHDVVVLYAYCRRVDDAIDRASPRQQPQALARLHAELDEIYGDVLACDPAAAAFQNVVRARSIPRAYPEELLAGMAMDVRALRYDTLDELLGYAYRVAGVVGLMMCHVMGVRSSQALRHAAHLGLAMQLTNIARDVAEDWQRGRLYLPRELLAGRGFSDLGVRLPEHARLAVAGAVAELLGRADAYYRSGEAGLCELSPRCALAVDAARLIYADIGRVLRAQACDPIAGRAVVSTPRKCWLLARACMRALARLPRTWRAPRVAAPARILSRQGATALHGGWP